MSNLNIQQIQNNIFLGSQIAAQDLNLLKSINVTHILNVALEIPNFHENSFKYLKLNVNDDIEYEIGKHFYETQAFIESAHGNVLVHCQAGISRSATIVIAFLMNKHKMSLKDAFFLVKSKKHNIGPNQGFFKQLIELEKQLNQSSDYTPSFGFEEYYIQTLIDMGFDKDSCIKAVQKCDGRLEFALEILLQMA